MVPAAASGPRRSFLLGIEAALRDTFGSLERYVEYHRALRTGELPEHIEPDAWRGWLSLSRIMNALAQLLAVLFVLLVVAPILIYRPAYHPVAMGLLGLLVLWRLVFSWRKRARIARLTAKVEMYAELETDAGAQPTPEEEAAESWFRSSLAARMIPIAVVLFSLALAIAYVDRLYNGDDGSLVGLLVWAAFAGLVPATFMLVGNERHLSRDFGSLEQYNAYTAALKTGELPAHIDPDAWRALLSRSRRLNRMGPFWLLGLVVFGVLPSLITHSAYWLTALAFGLEGVFNLVSWWQRRGEIARLAAEVERRTPGDLLERAN